MIWGGFRRHRHRPLSVGLSLFLRPALQRAVFLLILRHPVGNGLFEYLLDCKAIPKGDSFHLFDRVALQDDNIAFLTLFCSAGCSFHRAMSTGPRPTW